MFSHRSFFVERFFFFIFQVLNMHRPLIYCVYNVILVDLKIMFISETPKLLQKKKDALVLLTFFEGNQRCCYYLTFLLSYLLYSQTCQWTQRLRKQSVELVMESLVVY